MNRGDKMKLPEVIEYYKKNGNRETRLHLLTVANYLTRVTREFSELTKMDPVLYIYFTDQINDFCRKMFRHVTKIAREIPDDEPPREPPVCGYEKGTGRWFT